MLLEILPAHRKKEIGPQRQAARGQKGLIQLTLAHRKEEIGPLRQAARGQKGLIRHHRMRPDGVKNHFHQSRKRGKMDQILHQEEKGMEIIRR